MRPIVEGDKFSFTDSAEAILLRSPFGGYLGYQAPAHIAIDEFKPELLSEKLTISKDEVLVVKQAYESICGWCVTADWKGYFISFHQASPEGIRTATKIVTPMEVILVEQEIKAS